ncbi:MAG: ABC transporter substrate-binding protein [Solirubrobacterales bacterium]
MLLLLAGLISAVLVAGCGSSSSSSSTEASSSTGSSGSENQSASSGEEEAKESFEPITVSYPFVALVQFYPLVLAEEDGVFEEYGLDVSVKTVPDPTISAAMNSGSVQFHLTAPPVLEFANNAGVDTELIGVYAEHTESTLTAVPGINSVKELVGKKIMETTPTGQSVIFSKYALHKAGVNYDEVKFVPVGTTAPAESLISGLVDAANTDSIQQALAEEGLKGAKVIEDFSTLEWPGAQIWGSGSWMEGHEEETAAFLQAMNAAVEKWNEDPAAAKKVISKTAKTTEPKLLNQLYEATKSEFNSGPQPVQPPSEQLEAKVIELLNIAEFSEFTEEDAKEGVIWTSKYWDAAFE